MAKPVSFDAGTNMTVTVTTDTKTIRRTVTLSEEMEIASETMNSLTFDISGNGYSSAESVYQDFTGINIGTLPSSLAASDNNSYDWGFTNCQIAGDGGQGLPNRLRPRAAGSCISIPTFGDRIVTKIRLYAHASNANMPTNTISLNDGEPVAFASYNDNDSNVNKNGGILEIDVPETLQGQALALNWGSNTNAAICAIAFEFAE